MKLYKNMATLLAVAIGVATDQIGHTYRIETSSEDGIADHDQDFQFYFYGHQSGGASSPTSKMKVQTSPDGATWVDLIESTKLTTEGDKAETKAPLAAPLLKFVRAVTMLGGGTNPNHTCEVRLVSTGSFRLKTVT